MRQGTYGAVAAFQDETGQEHPRMSQWWMGLLQVGNADIKRDIVLRCIKRFFIRSNSSDWVYKVTAALSFCCSFWHFGHYSANLDLWFLLLPAATLRAHNLDSNSCENPIKEVAIKKIPNSWQNTTEADQDIATFSSVFVQIGWGAEAFAYGEEMCEIEWIEVSFSTFQAVSVREACSPSSILLSLESHFERLSVVCGRSSCWRCWITRMWSNCFRHWTFISWQVEVGLTFQFAQMDETNHRLPSLKLTSSNHPFSGAALVCVSFMGG